ncbi:MAG: type II secretion system protein [Gallionella sp.]|nr:type II secretion system protein [Gallionella sp.]MDP1939484.1 type II secretion system protein [Gallionella sp.]
MNRVRQSGFTYLAALFLVAIMGAVLATTGVVWSTSQQRDRERELLLVGKQFRDAIGQYYEHSPGSLKKYPETLDDLLKDERQLATRRYLRKVFIDPMTRTNKWGVVPALGGGIMGVYSLSDDKPLKTGNFNDNDQYLAGKTKYSEWRFIYRPVQPKNPS